MGLDSAAYKSQDVPDEDTLTYDAQDASSNFSLNTETAHHISGALLEGKSVSGLDSAAYKSQDVPDEDTLTYDEDVTGGLSHLSPVSQGDWGTVPSVTSVSPDTETAHHSSGALVEGDEINKEISARTRAFVKIQDGCNLFCSYCIIPYARGRNRSRSVDEIVEEVCAIAAAGIREVVLTGIHISSYGTDKSWGVDEVSSLQAHAAHDTPSAPSSPDQTLLRTEGYSQGLGLDSAAYKSQPAPANSHVTSPLLCLLELIHGIDGIERIRLSSLEPRIVTDEFAAGLSALPKVCPHFHLSLQSGDNATLMRMRRHYTAGEYRRSVNALRRVYENPAITTDIIVGFPGETQEQFARTLSFAKEIGFYEIHVFPYSTRKGTAAASFEGQLTNAVKKERASALLALTAEQSKAYREQFMNQSLRVLFEDTEQIDGHTYLIGNTERYVRAAYDVTGLSREEIDALSGTFFEGVATCFLNDETLLFG
ncbi:MAG: radical SAM protein [Lachnospiraceae bacterium]|nr:radical SAM protein [Lachnospiraceae bacterium]